MKEIFIEKPQPWNTQVRVHIRKLIGNTWYIAVPIVFKKQEEGQYSEACTSLEYEEAQLLMDALWSAGFKPSEGSGSAGALAATQRHLEDMRTLVFKDNR